jgi:L-asparaginase II
MEAENYSINFSSVKVRKLRGHIEEASTTCTVCTLAPGRTSNRTGDSKPSGAALDVQIPLMAVAHPFQALIVSSALKSGGTNLTSAELVMASGVFAGTAAQPETFTGLNTTCRKPPLPFLCGERKNSHPCLGLHRIIQCLYGKAPSKETYVSPETPSGREIESGLLRMCRKLKTELLMVTDQCGLPTPVLSVKETAVLYHHLTVPNLMPPMFSEAAQMLLSGLRSNPESFAPPDSPEGSVLKISGGDIFLRIGENGLAAGCSITTKKSCVVKAEDGCPKNAFIAFLHAITNWLPPDKRGNLERFRENLSVIRSDAGNPAGNIKVQP